MTDKREEILMLAERLTQTRGFNGFSYIDLSKEIGIKTSSIHYYFKAKNNLAVALIERYHANFRENLASIDREYELPEEKIKQFIRIFENLSQQNHKFCLCGMMAAELATLSEEVHAALCQYFQTAKNWLTPIFERLGSSQPADDASAYFSMLEGALLIARVECRPSTIGQSSAAYLQKFEPKR